MDFKHVFALKMTKKKSLNEGPSVFEPGTCGLVDKSYVPIASQRWSKKLGD